MATEDRPVFFVLPRGMNYSPARASSIDLFVSEIAAASRLPIEIVAEADDPALPARRLHRLPRFAIFETLRRARLIAKLAAERRPRLIVVQQHLPSAAAITQRVAAPVLLQRHNFMRPPRPGATGAWNRALHAGALGAMAGITFVSEAAREEFTRDWSEVTTPRWVVPNGADLSQWRPAARREKTVLVVGRASKEKGLLEAAEALARTLPQAPGWTATFVVANARRRADYLGQVRDALAPLGERARMLADIPFAEVKALNERAAIALIPSKWREPFGRTCLEALAGGAAVISSGSGGLKEISGEAAIYVPDADPAGLAEALRTMIGDDGLRAQLAAAGRARAAGLYDLPAVAARLDAVCEAVIAARPT